MSREDSAAAIARDLRRALEWQCEGAMDLLYPGEPISDEDERRSRSSNGMRPHSDRSQSLRPQHRSSVSAPKAPQKKEPPAALTPPAQRIPQPPPVEEAPPTRSPRRKPAHRGAPAPWKKNPATLRANAPPLSPALQAVRDELGDCQRCGLCHERRNIVFGRGSARPRLVFIGEAPGFHEDRSGEPFVGKAGKLLERMVRAMKLSEDEIYITNVLKCRPPNNRDPSPDEVAACSPFLERQLAALGPTVIVTLGRFATHTILGTQGSLQRIRGSWHEAYGVPVMPTFHPAYLLRNPDAKREAWADLQQVMQRLGSAKGSAEEG